MYKLNGKCIIIGVSGGIAAYKIADLVSSLVKTGADVHVIMTENATKFITPLTFETLTNNKCFTDTFEKDSEFNVTHISLAKKANLILIAPATANIIAKMANGIADNMLTTVVLAAKCKKLFAPSMNTAMLENPITQDNIKKLIHYGFEIIDSNTGRLACGDFGKGKLPSPNTLFQYILKELAYEKDMKGYKVLVTAGPTQEALDPVRYITNHSSGKMGYEIARNALFRGAEVTLISGKVDLEEIPFIELINITSAKDMYKEVISRLDKIDILIKAAAVADYRPINVSENKIKKKDNNLTITLEKTEDILQYCGTHKKENQFICGFSMETENMIENSKKKLIEKNIDMIACNNLKQKGAGFGVDTNIITIITKDNINELPLLSKNEAANKLLDEIMKIKKNNLNH